eukprot:1235616-Amphidinium_carterae.1
MATIHAKLQELWKGLATVYVEIKGLPEEVLPMPKKVAAATFRPATVELMKYVKEKALEGDSCVTTLPHDCVEELKDSC